MTEIEKSTIEFPIPKNPREAEAYDFARRIVEHVIENPVAFRNGINYGRTIGEATRAKNPIKAIQSSEAWKNTTVISDVVLDSPAFNIGLVAATASEIAKKKK